MTSLKFLFPTILFLMALTASLGLEGKLFSITSFEKRQRNSNAKRQNTGHRHKPFLTAVDHVTDLHVEAPVFGY